MGHPELKRFSFDTSAFIEPWRRHYPIDIAPSLWDRIDSLGKDGVVVAQEEVLLELQKIDDELLAWASDRQHLFVETTEEVQIAVRSIMQSHPDLVSAGKGRSGADPWVIAQAMVSNASVVTYETWNPKQKRVKIPKVCQLLGVRCLKFIDFMRECRIELKV